MSTREIMQLRNSLNDIREDGPVASADAANVGSSTGRETWDFETGKRGAGRVQCHLFT